MEKKVDEMVWKAFEKSGDAGLFMLYNALRNEGKDPKKNEE